MWACLLVAYTLYIRSVLSNVFSKQYSNQVGISASSIPLHLNNICLIQWTFLNDTVIKWSCLLVAYPLPFRQDSSSWIGCFKKRVIKSPRGSPRGESPRGGVGGYLRDHLGSPRGSSPQSYASFPHSHQRGHHLGLLVPATTRRYSWSPCQFSSSFCCCIGPPQGLPRGSPWATEVTRDHPSWPRGILTELKTWWPGY